MLQQIVPLLSVFLYFFLLSCGMAQMSATKDPLPIFEGYKVVTGALLKRP